MGTRETACCQSRASAAWLDEEHTVSGMQDSVGGMEEEGRDLGRVCGLGVRDGRRGLSEG